MFIWADSRASLRFSVSEVIWSTKSSNTASEVQWLLMVARVDTEMDFILLRQSLVSLGPCMLE